MVPAFPRWPLGALDNAQLFVGKLACVQKACANTKQTELRPHLLHTDEIRKIRPKYTDQYTDEFYERFLNDGGFYGHPDAVVCRVIVAGFGPPECAESTFMFQGYVLAVYYDPSGTWMYASTVLSPCECARACVCFCEVHSLKRTCKLGTFGMHAIDPKLFLLLVLTNLRGICVLSATKCAQY